MKINKGDSTKTKILKAATELIAKHGFGKVTFQDIANKCKIHQPAIFYYFPTKEDLCKEVVAGVIQNSHLHIAELTKTATSTRQALSLHFEGNLSWAVRNPDAASVLLFLYYSAAVDSKQAAIYEPILEVARSRIEKILNETRKNAKDIQFLARILHDNLLGGIVNYLASGRSDKELLSLKKRWKVLQEKLLT